MHAKVCWVGYYDCVTSHVGLGLPMYRPIANVRHIGLGLPMPYGLNRPKYYFLNRPNYF